MNFLKEFFKLVFVWIVIFVACLLVLEFLFRTFRDERDPLVDVVQKQSGHLFDPGTSLRSASSIPGEFDYMAHINRYGYRGQDFAMPKPAGTIRIFAVGDSFTFGVGSPDDMTIPVLLEKDLKEAGLPVEVVNAGVGGEGTVQHYVNLRKVHLQYQPDAVVLLFDLTDLWDDWYAERHAIRGPDGEIDRFDPMFVNGKRDWWVTLTYHSVFCRYFHNKVIRTLRKMQALGVGGFLRSVKEGKRAKAVIANADHEQARKAAIEYDGLLFMRGHEREDLIREHWPRTEAYLLKIRDLLAKRGIPFVIVMYPQGIYVDGDQWKEGRKTWGFEPGKRYDDYLPFDLMRTFCRDNNIPFVNTLDAFLKAPKDKYFFDWDGHMTVKGNAIVASVVAGDGVLRKMLREKVDQNGMGK
jgi:hypothetical protein